MVRVRRRYSTMVANWNGALVDVISAHMEDDNSPRIPLRWKHVVNSVCTQPVSGSYGGYGVTNYCNAFDGALATNSIMDYVRENLVVPLDFQQNDAFEIIPFLADLDGTIAQFTVKFWKQISYGSLNWGVLPFISDLKSLSNTLSDLFNDGIYRSFNKLAGKKVSRRMPINLSGPDWRAEGTANFSGHVIIDERSLPTPGDFLLIMMDELGFHPDLKTVWDIVPLSFVLDYFIPVGDFLESLHPRGWYNPEFILSDGGYSFAGKVRYRYPLITGQGPEATYDVYRRKPGLDVRVSTRPRTEISWRSPSPRQLFNTAYLMRARGGRN